jgi:hypothetical protein
MLKKINPKSSIWKNNDLIFSSKNLAGLNGSLLSIIIRIDKYFYHGSLKNNLYTYGYIPNSKKLIVQNNTLIDALIDTFSKYKLITKYQEVILLKNNNSFHEINKHDKIYCRDGNFLYSIALTSNPC